MGDTTFGLTVFSTIGGSATNNSDYQFLATTPEPIAGQRPSRVERSQRWT
jgi:hypothetical protein